MNNVRPPFSFGVHMAASNRIVSATAKLIAESPQMSAILSIIDEAQGEYVAGSVIRDGCLQRSGKACFDAVDKLISTHMLIEQEPPRNRDNGGNVGPDRFRLTDLGESVASEIRSVAYGKAKLRSDAENAVASPARKNKSAQSGRVYRQEMSVEPGVRFTPEPEEPQAQPARTTNRPPKRTKSPAPAVVIAKPGRKKRTAKKAPKGK